MKKVKLNDENIHKGYLILINPDNLLKTNEIKLISYSEKYKNIELDQVANSQLQKALKSINANDEIVPISGVRTFEEQKRLYTDSIIENGEEYTKKFVALPNASEHQTGLAIDLALNKPNIDFICPSFPYNGICQEFRKIAPNFGFIERYKDEKKNNTKIAKEEWHFRFVGYPHSKIITNKDLCLEEYIEYLKEYKYPKFLNSYGYKISYIPYENQNETIILQENQMISGNNVDGFILSERVSDE